MKKRYAFSIIFFLLVVCIAFFYVWLSADKIVAYNAFKTAGGFLSFSAVGATNWNQYVEGRCIDTTQYLSQGYSFSRVDSANCTIVKKAVLVASVDIGRTSHCKSGVSTNRNFCTESLGSAWSSYDCNYNCGKRCSWGNTICQQFKDEEKGGWENVISTCAIDTGDVIVAESFTGGSSLTKFTTRYPPKAFCYSLPAILTTPGEVRNTNSLYVDIQDAKTITVPSDSVLTIFYATELNSYLPTTCDPAKGLAVNVNTGRCVPTSAFAYICNGNLNPTTGECITQDQSACEKNGGFYNTLTGICSVVAPKNVACVDENGSILLDAFYSIDRNSCVRYTQDVFKCDDGYKFIQPESESQCSSVGGVWEACPQCASDKVCSSTVCQPRCSKGLVCVSETTECDGKINDKGQCVIEIGTVVDNVCDDYDGRIVDGVCYTFTPICNGDEIWNKAEKRCEKDATKSVVCPDGSAPVNGLLSGTTECLDSQALSYVKTCSDPKQIYSFEQNDCVDAIKTYDPVTQEFFDFKASYTGCFTDSSCGEGNSCQDGICYSSKFVKDNSAYLWVAIGVLVILLLFALLVKRK